MVDAAMRLQAIREALLRAGEITSCEDRWKVTAVIRTPETSKAFAILDSIERAAVMRNTETGLAACRELRTFGSEHG
jgi:hypothetical protein